MEMVFTIHSILYTLWGGIYHRLLATLGQEMGMGETRTTNMPPISKSEK